MRITRKPLLVVALSAGLLASSATAASAYGSYGSYGGGSYGGELKAASYINPDVGGRFANPDVAADSSCFKKDQYDMQAFSDPLSGTPGNKNVHNDACFLDSNGKKQGKNIGATFQATGTGFISACPDPDGNTEGGPSFRKLRDLTGPDGRPDGLNDSCFQSSYQENDALPGGNFEYHARVNNTGMPGSQNVKWGMDSDADGRIDGWNNDSVKVDWSADGKQSFSSYSR